MLSYLIGDHLGSTSLTTNASGTKIGEMKYYPYGETRYSWGSTPTDRRFTGQWQEDVAALGSLYDYGARMYSPLVGRFLSADTIVPNPKNPQSLNRFAYVQNNPLKYTDPTGHLLCNGCVDLGGLSGTGTGGGSGGGSFINTAWSALEVAASYFIPPVRYALAARDVLSGDLLKGVEAVTAAASGFSQKGLAHAAGMTSGDAGAAQQVLAGAEAANETEVAETQAEAESVNAASTESVQAYEVGQVNDLRARSAVGDGLDIHHVPQAHAAEQIIPGYTRATGPGIALPQAEHDAVNALNVTGVYGGTARDLIARNLWALHELTSAPNSALQGLLSLIRTMYPGVLNKH